MIGNLERSTLPPRTLELLQLYLRLPFRVVSVSCPYWMNKLDKGIRGPFSGKGTPKQIVSAAYRRAGASGVDLDSFSAFRLKTFLKQNRIGIDCSGFAFHLLNSLDRERGGAGISKRFLRGSRLPSWRVAWRCNSDLITSSRYNRKVDLVDVRAGDTIRMKAGGHLLVVVEVKRDLIVYAHSSQLTTKVEGVHKGRIGIVSGRKSLSDQMWFEKTAEGEDYGRKYFNPLEGDGIGRFRWW